MCEMSGSFDFPRGVGTQMMIVGGRAPRAGDRQPPGPTRVPIVARHVLDRALAASDQRSPRIGVRPDHAHAGLGEGHGERQPDVAEPDDADRRVSTLEPLHEIRPDTAAS
jgi:hypothetical protein